MVVSNYCNGFSLLTARIAMHERKDEVVSTKLLLLVFVCSFSLLSACDSKDWEAAGYQDGYAETINTTCKFRATNIHGKFDNSKYAAGYSRGAQAGAAAVAREGCAKLK